MAQSLFATVVVCPSSLQLEGLVRILESASFDVVATAASVGEVAPGLLSPDQPVLLILHVSDDDDAGTVSQIQLFRAQHPTARIALLNDYDQLNYDTIIAAFRAGADAYFLKPSHDTLLRCLELVLLGETILPPTLLASMLDYPNGVIANGGSKNEAFAPEATRKYEPRLSKRQADILSCLIQGDSNKIIARKNNIAEATVKVHVKAILREIGVCNRTQAAMWAVRNGALSSMREREPARAPMMAEPSLPGGPPADPPEAGRDMMAPPAHLCANATMAPEAMKTDLPWRASMKERLDRARERRLAEEAERRQANVAKTTQLRELRQARDAAVHGSAAMGAACKPVAPFPTDKPIAEHDK
ncbi:DNA-binding response regulator, NarL/FixJ family, contains REC and HTH domains [Rhizobiales bacterium GAS188]|nr:DNA-binding response regulator, NarL/FixJ family, contains REC and HTH domains [Rhizobiales bacterium GAS188]